MKLNTIMKKIQLLFLALITFGSANAAIVYNDIADVTLTSDGEINIDFNGGGTDFMFENNSFGGTIEPALEFNPDAGFVMLGNVVGQGHDEIIGLAINTPINSTSYFANNGGDGFVDPGFATTPFTVGDSYIGATFKIGTNVHYGWILVNWDANGTFIVKSYAYENTVATSILAGDTGVTINVDVTGITVTGAGGQTVLAGINLGNSLQMSAAVLPANATDNTVTWSVINGTGTGSITSTGLLTGTTMGMVTVKATANDGSGVIGVLDITFEVTGGINDNATLASSAYPNPFTNTLSVKTELNSTISIIDLTGKTVFSTFNTTKVVHLNLTELKIGIYFLSVSNNSKKSISKLIKK